MTLNKQANTGGGIFAPEKARDSNIELFRILTMSLIVAHHFVVNSGLTAADGPIYSDPLSWRSLFLLVFGAWGKTGINCFVLITGYFMCKSHITAKKFAKLFCEWMFYRLVIRAVFWISGYESFSLKALIKALIPITSISNGFTPAFILFFLFIPFLNILVQNLKERQHLLLLVWCAFTYVFLGTFPGLSVTMNYVSWFSVLYMISSYLRLYPKDFFHRTKLWGLLSLLCIMLDIASVISCAWLGRILGRYIKAFYFVTDSNTFLAIATGICLFMFFKNLSIKHNAFINTIAASTFGVLCIHAHSDTMRQWLWKDTVDCVGHYDSPLMPLYAIGAVLAIFIVCVIIDQLRIRLIEKLFFKLWDKHWDHIQTKYKKIESRVLSKIGVQK